MPIVVDNNRATGSFSELMAYPFAASLVGLLAHPTDVRGCGLVWGGSSWSGKVGIFLTLESAMRMTKTNLAAGSIFQVGDLKYTWDGTNLLTVPAVAGGWDPGARWVHDTLAVVAAQKAQIGTRASATDIPNVALEWMVTPAYPNGAWFGHLGTHASQASLNAVPTLYLATDSTAMVAGIEKQWNGSYWIAPAALGGGIDGVFIDSVSGSPSSQLAFTKIAIIDPADIEIDDGTYVAATLDTLRPLAIDASNAGSGVTISGGIATFAEVTTSERWLSLLQLRRPFRAFWQLEASLTIPSDGIATLSYRKQGDDTFFAVDISRTGWKYRQCKNGTVGMGSSGAFAFGGTTTIRVVWRRNVMSIRALVNGAWIVVGGYGISPSLFTASDYVSLQYFDDAGFKFAIGAKSVASSPVSIRSVSVSSVSPLGIRDQQLITYSDGRPFMDDSGNVYMTATAGAELPSGDGIASSYAIVLRVNRTTMVPVIVGQMRTWRRPFAFQSGEIGEVSDSPIKIIYDTDSNQWIGLASTFGDGGGEATYNKLNVSLCRFYGNPIAGSSIILPTTERFISLNSPNVICYDADIIYHGGFWHMVYVAGSTYNGYAESILYRRSKTVAGLATAQDFGGIGGGEGPKFLRFAGSLYVIISNTTIYKPSDSGLVYDGSAAINTSGMILPHFAIVPFPSKGGTVFKIATFDQVAVSGNFSWGMWHIYESGIVPGILEA